MANDKDFLLKNAVEVGGSVKTTVGTITSNDIDLSTGNYFNDTLAADTTYTFSNAGDVQSFQLEVTGASKAYKIADYEYESKSYDMSTNHSESAPIAIHIKPDGTKVFISGNSTDNIFQLDLSTPYDISTASGTYLFTQHQTETSLPYGFTMGNGGTKVYVLDYGGTLYQYSLATAYDFQSTETYDNKTLDITTQSTNVWSVRFNADGDEVFVASSSNNIYQYSLTTPWDIDSGSYTRTLDVSGTHTNLSGIEFNSDGTKLFTTDNTSDTIYEWSLTTEYDISTATATGNSLDVSSVDGTPYEIAFMNNGSNFILVGSGNDTLFQYVAPDTTLTWPDTIEWPDGTAPLSPSNGEKDLYTFTTDDSGTTYKGVLSAYNLS